MASATDKSMTPPPQGNVNIASSGGGRQLTAGLANNESLDGLDWQSIRANLSPELQSLFDSFFGGGHFDDYQNMGNQLLAASPELGDAVAKEEEKCGKEASNGKEYGSKEAKEGKESKEGKEGPSGDGEV